MQQPCVYLQTGCTKAIVFVNLLIHECGSLGLHCWPQLISNTCIYLLPFIVLTATSVLMAVPHRPIEESRRLGPVIWAL